MPDEAGPIAQGVISAGITGLNAITKGGPRRQYKWAKKYANYANEMNRKNAEWQLEQNKAILADQRAYDSPAQKMQRLKEAGLNPHLAYENVGGMNSPMINMSSLPAANYGHVDTSYSEIGSDFMNAQMAQTQMGLTNQKISESETKQQVMEAQEQLLKANPQMRPAYVDALVKQLEATAAIKAKESAWFTEQTWRSTGEGLDKQLTRQSNGWTKMDKELEILFQKYKLNEADQQVKARTIESKDWENDVKEIQSKWLKDGEITPQHIYQAIMMMLMKLR